MKYFIESGHDAAIKALKTGDSRESDRIHSDHEIIMNLIFNKLTTHAAGCFTQKSGENIVIWTRSTRPGVKVQESHAWDRNGEIIPLSHHDIDTAAEMVTNHGYYANAYIKEVIA